MATSNNELIRVEHVVKEFDGGAVKALNDCNLTINRGEVVAIIGPSGSGKSTLLRCLNLLEVPTSGSVWFNGVDITDKKIDLDLHRRKMGMVFQHFNLFPNMTVLKNLTLAPVHLKLLSKAEADEKALRDAQPASACPTRRTRSRPCSLAGRSSASPSSRALMMQPEVMLFDEPTSALDPEMVGEVLDHDALSRRGRDDDGRRHARDGLCPRGRQPGHLHGRRRDPRGKHAERAVRPSAEPQNASVPFQSALIKPPQTLRRLGRLVLCGRPMFAHFPLKPFFSFSARKKRTVSIFREKKEGFQNQKCISCRHRVRRSLRIWSFRCPDRSEMQLASSDVGLFCFHKQSEITCKIPIYLLYL